MRELVPVLVAGLVPLAVLTLIVIGTALSLVAWQPPMLVTTQFGTAQSYNGISVMSSDPTGIYAAGFVGGNAGLNVTPSYLFVGRYDLDGRLVWTQQIGKPTLSQILGLAVGTDGVYIAGYLGVSANSSFVRKYDLNGNQAWNVQFENFTKATAISVTASRVYVGVSPGIGFRDYLDSYYPNGTQIWTRPITNYNYRGVINIYALPSTVYVFDVATRISGSSGSPTITLFQKYDSAGTLMWNSTVSLEASGISGDSGGIYVVGPVQTPGRSNGFLSKLDFDGNHVWTTNFSAPGFNSVSEIRVSADSSGVYLAATTTDDRGIVMKYDMDGNQVWSVQLPWKIYTSTSVVVITVQTTGVYVGGSLDAGSSGEEGFLAESGKSSSLVFFGTNPPLSFELVALLAAVAVTSVLWLRRRVKKRLRRPSANVTLLSKRIPKDICSPT